MDDILSPTDFIQASRVLRLSSPLGEDQLLPERMTVEEGVNRLFEITLSVRAKREAVKPEELIGKLVDVSLEIRQGEFDEDGVRRPFNGLVTDIEEGPPVTRGLRSYTLTIRPQMWLLSRRSDCRIWQDMTSIQVLETLFSEHGLPAPDIGFLHNKPPAQTYSVQWNEDDLSYLLRRLEEDGVFYWFLHEPGLHRLRVTDHQIGWSKPSDSAEGEDKVRLAQGSSDRNHITEWMRRFRFIPGKRVDADWNFETPSTVPLSTTPSLVQMPGSASRELYEYPARISDHPEAERAGKLRAQASEAEHERVRGQSTVRFLEPGRRFTPYEEPNPEHKYEEFVITQIRHQVVDRSYETAEDQPEYTNSFKAVPSRVPYTPQRTTHRPRIEGAQVAIVAGPQGEEIHPDKYGRIKLWFPWDRRARKDGSDTCWVRVSQSWAGGLWGSQVIPRIGMEVMVAYVDGDPDRPLVTGVVPNPKNAVPYELPANKTRMVLRSNTHKGSGFNEMAFEDDNGKENMFFHAQRDQTNRVNNTRITRVDGHDVSSVGGSKTSEIGQNLKQDVAGSMNVTVGAIGAQAQSMALRHAKMAEITAQILDDAGKAAGQSGELTTFIESVRTLALGFFGKDGLAGRGEVSSASGTRADAGASLAVAGNKVGDDAENLFDETGSLNEFIVKSRSQTVGSVSMEQVGDVKVTNVGAIRQSNVGRTDVTTIGLEQETHVGERKAINVGKVFEIEVGERFSIKVGASSLVMDSSGSITITGANSTIVKGGAAHITIGPGPILYTPVLIKGGAAGSLASGVPKKTRKPFAEECPLNDKKV